MAKQIENLAGAIRAAVDKLGGVSMAKPKAIQQELSKRAIKVSEQYISAIKSQYRKRLGLAAGRKGRKGQLAAAAGTDALKAAITFVKKAGGFDRAKRALDTLQELQVKPI